MKPRNQSLRRAARSTNLLGLFTITFTLLTAGQSMAQSTWTGDSTEAWDDADNWLDTATLSVPGAPDASTVLTFGGATYGAPINQPNNNDFVAFTTGAINFASDGTLGQITGFTLGAADLSQSITLGGNITTTPIATGGATITDTIYLNLALDASRNIDTGFANSQGHNLNIRGVISAVGSFGLTKTGGALLSLANVANSFSGDMSITGGTVIAPSLQATGTNSSIGSGSAINLAGTLSYNTVPSVAVVAPAAAINRTINLTGSGGINIETGANNFTFNGTFTNADATAKTFTLGGAAASHTFSGNLVDNGAGVLAVTKSGANTWTLNGTNTYTGATTVTQGTLNVASIADSVTTSHVGYGTAFVLGDGANTGTLNYTGNNAATTRQLTLGGGGGINAGGTNGGAGLRFTNAAFNLTTTDVLATRTLTLGGANTDANEISGVIIDGNTNLKTALAKKDGGRWLLTGANTYTGATQINGGTLEINALRDVGTASSLGAPLLADSIIRIGDAGNTVTLTHTTGAANSSTNRQIQIGNGTANSSTGGATIVSNGTGILEFTNAIFNIPVNTGTGTGSNTTRTLTLRGTNTGLNRVAGVIANNLQSETPIVALTKNDAGTWVLEGANTYTGPTNIATGTLNVSKIADSGSGFDSNIGFGATLLIGNNNFSGTLNYNGTGDTTARQLTIGSSTGNCTSTINNNSTATSSELVFSNTAFNVAAGTSTGGGNGLILGGSNTDANEITGTIINNATTRGIYVIKNDAGRWILAGTSTFTGSTYINNGTLEVKKLADVATASSLGAPAAGASSVIRMGDSTTTGTLLYTGSADSATNRQIQIGFNIGSNATGGATIRSSGGGILEFTNAAFNTPVNTGGPNNPGINTRTLTLGGTNTGLNRIAGVIANNLQAETPKVAVTKEDAGKWVLEGANTYTGDTTVSAGTLVLADNAQLKFLLGNSSGSNNSLTGAGTATLDGDFVITTTAADGLTSGTWILENVSNLTGAYSSSFTVVGFTDAGSDKWTKTIGAKTYTFDETTGTLTLVTVTDPFITWAGAGVNGFDADANGDGVDNGLAWLLGAANKEVSALDKLPVVTQSGGLVMTFKMLPESARGTADLYLEYSTDLATWSTQVLVPDSTGGAAPVTFTVSGTNPLDVQATVSSTEGPDGKLFGRLKAVK